MTTVFDHDANIVTETQALSFESSSKIATSFCQTFPTYHVSVKPRGKTSPSYHPTLAVLLDPAGGCAPRPLLQWRSAPPTLAVGNQLSSLAGQGGQPLIHLYHRGVTSIGLVLCIQFSTPWQSSGRSSSS